MALSGTFLVIQMLFSGTAFCFLQTSGGVSGGVGVGGYGGAGGYGGFGGNGGANGGFNAGFNGKIGLGCFSVGVSGGVNGGAGAGAGNGSVNGGVNGGVSGGVNLQTRCVEEEPAHLSPDQFPTCEDSFEPQINIQTSVYDAIIVDTYKINFSNTDFGMHFTNATVTNNGLYVVLKSDDMKKIRISDDYSDFILEEIQFRWGESNLVGSDITRDNKSFPLMMQLMFYTTDAASYEDADKQKSGYLVLVQLFEIASNDNEAISDVTDALNNIKKVGRAEYIPQTRYTLGDILPKNNQVYDSYSYFGIMPFPTCGAAQWIVFNAVNTISKAQLDKFQQLDGIDREKLSENYPNFNLTFPEREPIIYYTFHRN